jgi:hypothetical protein
MPAAIDESGNDIRLVNANATQVRGIAFPDG